MPADGFSKDLKVTDLCEIMVFTTTDEYRYETVAGVMLVEFFSKVYRGYNLIDIIEWPGEQAGLVGGDQGEGVLLEQRLDVVFYGRRGFHSVVLHLH